MFWRVWLIQSLEERELIVVVRPGAYVGGVLYLFMVASLQPASLQTRLSLWSCGGKFVVEREVLGLDTGKT